MTMMVMIKKYSRKSKSRTLLAKLSISQAMSQRDLRLKLHVLYLYDLSEICNNVFFLLLVIDNKNLRRNRLRSGKNLRSLHITIVSNTTLHLCFYQVFNVHQHFTLRIIILQGGPSEWYYQYFIDEETEIHKLCTIYTSSERYNCSK